MRRLKKDVAKDLPQKIQDSACKQLPLSDAQRALYAQAIAQFSRRQEPGAVTPFKNALGPAALPARRVHGSADLRTHRLQGRADRAVS